MAEGPSDLVAERLNRLDASNDGGVSRAFGERMRIRREELHHQHPSGEYSRESLAKAMNRSVSLIAAWEQGRREPGLFDLTQLSLALRTDLDYLIRGIEQQVVVESKLLRTLAARIGNMASEEAEKLIKEIG